MKKHNDTMTLFLRNRIFWILMLLLFLFLCVFFRLFYLQVVASEDLKEKAEEQQMREVPVEAGRGTIFDRNGKVVAISVSVDSVYASPTQIDKAEAPAIAKALAETLSLDEEKVLAKLTSNRGYEWIKRKISEEESEALRKYDFDGIGFTAETERKYPNGTLASNILGFVGIDNQGLEGIEAVKDETLIGSNGSILAQYDSHGKEIAASVRRYAAPKEGKGLVLTIDENIQYFCERELDALVNSAVKPKGATILMMEPKSGEILALATRPNYDPNHFGDYDSSTWRNSAISDFYEPGSTAKILTLSAALEEGVVTESDTFYDSGSITVGKTKIRCWGKPHGSETLVEVAENSCNPAFVSIGQRIDDEDDRTFYRYLKAFGMGKKTGISLTGESSGSLRDLEAADSVNPLDVANMYIGQGYGVTALQLVTAVSAAVNGGNLMEPHLVKAVKDSEGNVVETIEPKIVQNVISEKTSQRVRSILESVVANGTGSKAYIEGYRVGGKTGTAQKFIDGAYSKTKYVASFIGFAPADDPKVVCLVVVDEPSSYPVYGGTIAAPVFQKAMTDTLSYLGVAPQMDAVSKDRENSAKDLLSKEKVTVPSLLGLSQEEAGALLEDKKLKAKVTGSGEMVVSQNPGALAKATEGSEVILTLGEKSAYSVTVPDCIGKRLLECDDLLFSLGLTLLPKGTGSAVAQFPEAGTAVPRGTSVTVKFSAAKDEEETMAP